MDTVLFAVTVISLALAASMGVVVARMLRDERRRSDARVAALIELAAEPAAPRPYVPEPAVRFAARPAAHSAADVRIARAETRADASREDVRREEDPRRDEDLRGFRFQAEADRDELEMRSAEGVAVSGLFAEPERSSPWLRRAGVVGAMALVGGAALFVLTLSPAEEPDGATPLLVATSEQPVVQPLELVSLRHTQEANTLMITGLVKNPRSGARLTRITATAVLFDAEGAIVASGKAPLDYTSLAAGDESPFVVTVPIRGAVARYRVGFRAEDGSVVAHVDRRSGDVSKAGL
jgi:hypothetical protein